MRQIALRGPELRHFVLAGRNDQAIEAFENLVRSEPNWRDGRIHLATAYANGGCLDQARKITRQILEQDPAHTASYYVSVHFFRNPERTEWLRDLLIKAGLPE